MWRIKVLYHNGKKIFAPYKRVNFLFFHFWDPTFLSEYQELDYYIEHETYDSFFFANHIGFYTEDDARKYIKLYEEHCELIEKTRKIKPEYIYPDEEPDGK